jgi:probable F420-dependent oxidoreductase
MELHVVLPSETDRMPASRLVEVAVLAEELGYAGVWLPDHILLPGGHGERLGGVYEPLITLSHIAALTTTIKLGTSVLVAPLRNPFVLARQVATLVALSGDRFQFGVGTGWNETEFREVGGNFERRGKTTDEAIRLVNHLLEYGQGPYEDGEISFSEGVFAPILGRRVPIHVGGTSKPAYRRAAELGDGWQGLEPDPAQFVESVRSIHALTERPLVMGTRSRWSEGRGSLESTLAEIDSLREVGADYLAIWFGEWETFANRMRTLSEATDVAIARG